MYRNSNFAHENIKTHSREGYFGKMAKTKIFTAKVPGLPKGLKTLGKISLSRTCYKSLDHIEETCSESFNTATKFIHHMRQVHKTKPWICTECPELKR